MWFVEKQFKVIIGGNVYVNVPNLVVYNDRTLFSLKRHDDNGQLGIYFELFDAQGGHVASVKRNQIYRAEGQGDRYRLLGSANECLLEDQSAKQIVCRIRRRSASPIELEVSVRLYTPDGFLFYATPTSTNLGGIVMTGNVLMNCATGINIAAPQLSIGGPELRASSIRS